MTATTGSTSVWLATASVPQFPALTGDERADVCIIGAGIAGLTTAYMLLRAGKTVVVIDAAGVGAGETGRSTAHFFPPDERYFEIEHSFGTENAKLVADAYRKATNCVESIIRTERIACEFERLDGFLFSPNRVWDDTLEHEYAVTTRLGIDVRRQERVPGLAFDTGPCLRFAGQAQFHPLKYLDGLARAIERMGGRIYDRTRALALRGEGMLQTVQTASGAIEAASVVVATNKPFNDHEVISAKQTGYRTYVLAVRVPKDALPRMLLWDTGDPYHYVRLAAGPEHADHELLIVGGQDHKSGEDGHPQLRYDHLEAWVRARFPLAGEVQYRWSGEVMEPADGVAFLGRNGLDHDNVYIITGDSGNGMTHCTVGAILISDLILGCKSDWTALYDPARKAFHGSGEFITAQASTLTQFTEWLRGGDVETVDEIGAGEGAVLRDDGKLLAVYRNDDGALQAVSAACTHLGCAVLCRLRRGAARTGAPAAGGRHAVRRRPCPRHCAAEN
ncbi:MAG: FAD-dependent oxidoreductase [Telluria sp.]